MAEEFNVTTTGTISNVILGDLGIELVHPETRDLLLEFSSDEVAESQSVADSIIAGYITAVDASGNSITLPNEALNEGLPVADSRPIAHDPVDNTKQMRIDVGAVATATTRVATMPDKDVTLGFDAEAIHDNVNGEINAVTTKATPVAADVLLIEDSAASFAKKKITLTDLLGGGGGPPSFKVGATSTVTRTLATYAVVPGMTITPGAGTYFVIFSTTASVDKNSRLGQFALFQNGSIVPDSMLEVGGQASNIGGVVCIGKITVSAGQAIDARWKLDTTASAPTLTVKGRNLILIEVS